MTLATGRGDLSALAALHTYADSRRRQAAVAVVGLVLLCLLVAIVAIGQGAAQIPPLRMLAILYGWATGGCGRTRLS